MHTPAPESDKAKVRAAVQARGLVSLMSDTKWRELVRAVSELPFTPAFQLKDVLGATPVPPTFDQDVWHCGDWSEGLYPYYSVEWIRVRPRIVRHRGNYAAPQIEDIGDAFLDVLHRIGVPHRNCEDYIEIFGYAQSTAGLHR